MIAFLLKIVGFAKGAWKWLWSFKIDLPALPVGVYIIVIAALVSGGPFLLDMIKNALRPPPEPGEIVVVQELRPFNLKNWLDEPLEVPISINMYPPTPTEELVDTCMSVPQNLDFALIPMQLGLPKIIIDDGEVRMAIWETGAWKVITYGLGPEFRLRPSVGLGVGMALAPRDDQAPESVWEVRAPALGPTVGVEARWKHLRLTTDVMRNMLPGLEEKERWAGWAHLKYVF